MDGSMVIGGAEYCGFGKAVDGSDGHPAALEAALAVAWAVDAGAVVVVGLVVVDVDDLLDPLNRRTETPTTTRMAMPMVTRRRRLWRRLTAFCSASRRAWRPAF